MTTIELRRLLPRPEREPEEIERRSYPTPVTLVRRRAGCRLDLPRRVRGGRRTARRRLIVSRYVDAWHVMNVAVDPDQRGRGVATMLLERLFDLTADDARRGYTLEVRVTNRNDPALRAARLQLARCVAATTRTTARR